jgi:hypothetical protein
MDQLAALLPAYRSAFANGLIDPATLSRLSVMILALAFLLQGFLFIQLRRKVRILQDSVAELQRRVPETESVAHFMEMQSFWRPDVSHAPSEERSLRTRVHISRSDSVSTR